MRRARTSPANLKQKQDGAICGAGIWGKQNSAIGLSFGSVILATV
jgi:hypothetical protein